MLTNSALQMRNEKTGEWEIVEPINQMLEEVKQKILVTSAQISNEEKIELKKEYDLWLKEMEPYGHMVEKEMLEFENFFN